MMNIVQRQYRIIHRSLIRVPASSVRKAIEQHLQRFRLAITVWNPGRQRMVVTELRRSRDLLIEASLPFSIPRQCGCAIRSWRAEHLRLHTKISPWDVDRQENSEKEKKKGDHNKQAAKRKVMMSITGSLVAGESLILDCRGLPQR